VAQQQSKHFKGTSSLLVGDSHPFPAAAASHSSPSACHVIYPSFGNVLRAAGPFVTTRQQQIDLNTTCACMIVQVERRAEMFNNVLYVQMV